jgi:hypothetical protein
VKNWYYAHGGTINYEDGTLDYPPSLRETALEILKILEDVRAGRVKVDREIDELTMVLLTVYFGAPSMFITLWFGFDY